MRIMTLLSLLTFVLLTGCDMYDDGEMIEDGDWLVIGQHGDYNLIRDVNTGCVYLQHEFDTSTITPYYDENGEVAGCGEKEKLEGKYN